VPKELTKVSHPVYTIEPPDILQIDLLTAIPKPPYRIRPLDVLTVAVAGALPESPIAGNVTVEPDGTIFLGPPYGSVTVGGLTLEEARKEVEQLLTKFVKKPEATVTLAQTRAAQQVRGPHLVRADGTIGLGIYGAVRVVGLTLPEAKRAVEEQLRTNFRDPEVAVDIIGYNSKVYYVVYDGGGLGQQVIRFPITGNETVLDGVGQFGGASPRPALSPYLNLLRTGSSPVVNYYGLVRPQQQTQNALQALQYQSQLPALAGGGTGAEQPVVTGNGFGFQTQRFYFQNQYFAGGFGLGAGGGTNRSNQRPGVGSMGSAGGLAPGGNTPARPSTR
jgi:protein involved in polysaccharide export with SLBB domain